jgi:acyl-CoA thioesterase-1
MSISYAILYSMKKAVEVILILALLIGAYIGIAELTLRPQVKKYADYWQREINKPTQENEIVYGVLGDSTAQGIGSSDPSHSYPALFARYLQEKTGRPVHIINVSKSGGRTTDVLDKQITELQKFKPDVITLGVGANDIYHGTTQEEIAKNFEKIIKQLPSGTIIAEIPYLMWPGKNTEAKFINSELQKIATDHNDKIVPLYAVTRHNHIKLNAYSLDFFHPSDRGYKDWAEVFWNTYLTE